MDAVASVAYDFENEQHAQTFAPFEERVLSCFAKETEGQQAAALLELLYSMKDTVLRLPTSVKTAECTIQRFYLLLLPLLNMVEQEDYAQAKSLTEKFFTMLRSSRYQLQIKVQA